jgi:cytosine/adenosine deaminase-related metal-dependent hydrolase
MPRRVPARDEVLYRAAWVLPIVTPPIPHGWVLVRDGVVAAVGDGAPPAADGGRARVEIDLGRRALLPGLVNAHTHLELAHLAGRVAPARRLPVWVCDLLAARGVGPPPLEPIAAAIAAARRAGTALVGDVSNSLASVRPLVESPLYGHVFYELIGFALRDAEAFVQAAAATLETLPRCPRVRASLTVHAPYSVGRALFLAVGRWLAAAPAGARVSIHLAESPEERQFLEDGTGPWRELLDTLHAWDAAWVPPGCGPVEYLERLSWLSDRLLAVHGVHVEAGELARLRDHGVTLVTCPRSNQWVGVGPPPLERFYASGVRVAIGTDSLASVPDLNLFAELAEARRLAPSVPARALLASATRHGAVALGFGDVLGAIAPGLRASLVAVEVPRHLRDVEEYLVSGVEPAQVSWVEPTDPAGGPP